MRVIKRSRALWSAVAVLLPLGLSGQAAAWSLDGRVAAGYQQAGEVRGSDAELDGFWYGASVEASYGSGRDWRLTLGAAARSWDAQWSAPVDFGLAMGKPFGKVRYFELSGNFLRRLDERFSLMAFGSACWARADAGVGLRTASFGSSDTYALAGVFLWNVNPRLTLGVGLMVTTAHEDSGEVFPIASLRYVVNPHWTVRLFEPSSFDDLDLAVVQYDPAGDGRVIYSAAVQWADAAFRIGRWLADESDIAVDQRVYRLLLGATVNLDSGFYLQPFAGYDIYRKMEFLSDGETLASHKVRGGWIAGLNAGLSF